MREEEEEEEEEDKEESFSSDEFADEGDWYASLVAGERVGEWLDVIETAVAHYYSEEEDLDASTESLKKAISNLTLKVREDETYGEEAEVAEAERRVREALEKVRARRCEKEEKDPQKEEEEELEEEKEEETTVSVLLEKSVDALETYRTKKKESAETDAIKNGRIEVSILETKLSNGVGGKLWKAAMLLAEQLDDEREEGEGESGGGIDVKDKTVLELGAGVGLVGLTAAKLSAKEVVLSDFEAPLLEALEESVKRNELVGKEGEEKTTKVRWLDWRADGAGEGTPTTSKPPDGFLALEKEDVYDIILGSDCLYESHHAALLPKVIKRRLSLCPNSRCRLLGAVRNRDMLDRLLENFRKERLTAKETVVAKSERLNYDGGYARVDVTHAI